MPPPGSIYAVREAGEQTCLKLGFTTSECPEQYIETCYARIMKSYEIIRISPVGDGRLGESMSFALLKDYRVHEDHEVFDIPDVSILHQAFDDVMSFFSIVKKTSPKTYREATIVSIQEVKTGQIVHKMVRSIFKNVLRTEAERISIEKAQEKKDESFVHSMVVQIMDNVIKSNKDRVVKKRTREEKKQQSVREFFSRVVRSSKDDFVHRAGLFEKYKQTDPLSTDLMRKSEFFEVMRSVLDPKCQKDRHGGYRDVFMGWRLMPKV